MTFVLLRTASSVSLIASGCALPRHLGVFPKRTNRSGCGQLAPILAIAGIGGLCIYYIGDISSLYNHRTRFLRMEGKKKKKSSFTGRNFNEQPGVQCVQKCPRGRVFFRESRPFISIPSVGGIVTFSEHSGHVHVRRKLKNPVPP